MCDNTTIKTNHGEIKLPAFLPDATYGSIRMVSFEDAKNAGVKEIVTTTLHLEQKIGSEYIRDFGGVHRFFGWERPVLTDSGGWQVFTLTQKSKGPTQDRSPRGKSQKVEKQNFITDVGGSFFDERGRQHLLTPESSIQIQFNLGSDIMTVLDHPISNESTLKQRRESIRINTLWAERAKRKFEEIYSGANFSNRRDGKTNSRPLLGAVIQGANDLELRKVSAKELVELDFDMYNYGGIPMHSPISWLNESPSGFNREMLRYVSEMIPDKKVKYAMGVGQPDDIAYCVDIGWNLFDTVLPTRNARHGYLYVSEGSGEETREYRLKTQNSKVKSQNRLAYDILRLRKEIYLKDDRPVDWHCDCECCRTVSRAYLRYLIRLKDPTGLRLATIHNLRFYSKWMNKLQSLA